MRYTKTFSLFPLNKGLDLSSTPGTQDPRSLKKAKNIVLRNRGSIRKAPGIRGIPYSGARDGIQSAVQFFGTSGSGQTNEIIQVRKGRVEVIRDGQTVDLGVAVSDSDTVVFEKFNNKLILNFENTRPKVYSPGGTSLSDLGILSGHVEPPPTMSVKHHEAHWYAGRGDFPHAITRSAINDIENYSLTNGGNQFSIDAGDGDPVGITGLSRTFMNDLFIFKWRSIHRLFLGGYGYSREQMSEGIGAVHHNTIVTLKNDIIFVSSSGIHTLSATNKHGAAEEATLSYPIYEWFQENVNWAASKTMKAAYDQQNNMYILSYPSYGSPVPDRILGFNLLSKEFFTWEDCEYPVVTEYFDLGRQSVMIGCNEKGLGVLDSQYTTRFDDEFDVEIKTGVIYPLDEKQSEINFTRCFLYAKPLPNSFEITFRWYVDGELVDEKLIDLAGGGSGSQISGDTIGDTSSNKTIQGNKKNLKSILIDLNCEGSAIEFGIVVSPSGEKDTNFEIYGLQFEFEYEEDSDTPKAS